MGVQMKRMHLMHLSHIALVISNNGSRDGVQPACCSWWPDPDTWGAAPSILNKERGLSLESIVWCPVENGLARNVRGATARAAPGHTVNFESGARSAG